MAEELGLEPGPSLQQLELAILARDPSLEPPNASPDRAGSAVAGRASRLVADSRAMEACVRWRGAGRGRRGGMGGAWHRADGLRGCR